MLGYVREDCFFIGLVLTINTGFLDCAIQNMSHY